MWLLLSLWYVTDTGGITVCAGCCLCSMSLTQVVSRRVLAAVSGCVVAAFHWEPLRAIGFMVVSCLCVLVSAVSVC